MKDWIIVGLSFIGSIIWSFIWLRILYSLKPNLNIENVSIEMEQRIKINVINKRKYSTAINVNIEACVVTPNNQTYHLDIDMSNFLMIPKKDYRAFQSYGLAKSAEPYYQKPFKDFIKEIVKKSM